MNESQTYTCENCGGTFEKNRSDEEAMAEALAADRFPVGEPVDVAVICDDCYNRMMAWIETQGGPEKLFGPGSGGKAN